MCQAILPHISEQEHKPGAAPQACRARSGGSAGTAGKGFEPSSHSLGARQSITAKPAQISPPCTWLLCKAAPGAPLPAPGGVLKTFLWKLCRANAAFCPCSSTALQGCHLPALNCPCLGKFSNPQLPWDWFSHSLIAGGFFSTLYCHSLTSSSSHWLLLHIHGQNGLFQPQSEVQLQTRHWEQLEGCTGAVKSAQPPCTSQGECLGFPSAFRSISESVKTDTWALGHEFPQGEGRGASLPAWTWKS